MTLDGRRVLVTGATGAVGQAVVDACLAAGASVKTFQRHGAPRTGVDVVAGDITDPDHVATAVQGCDAVVHLASLLHVSNPAPSLLPEYRRVNDEGTAHVVQACEHHGVARLVYASTIAVYGETRREQAPLGEDHPPAPSTAYGASKLAGEAHVRAARDAAGASNGVVLRLAAVYGAGVKGNYRRLARGIARGVYVRTGDGRNRRTLVHEADVAAATVLALTHPRAAGAVFNVTDGAVHEVREVVDAIATAMNRRPPRWTLPVPMVRAVASALETTAGVVGRRSPITSATIDKLLEDIAVDGTRIQASLGFRPRYSLVDGWREVIARWRVEGDLEPTGRVR